MHTILYICASEGLNNVTFCVCYPQMLAALLIIREKHLGVKSSGRQFVFWGSLLLYKVMRVRSLSLIRQDDIVSVYWVYMYTCVCGVSVYWVYVHTCVCIVHVYWLYILVCALYVCTGCMNDFIVYMVWFIVLSCIYGYVLYSTYAVFSTTVHKRIWWGVEVHRSVSLHNDCSHFIPCASPVYPDTVQGSGKKQYFST